MEIFEKGVSIGAVVAVIAVIIAISAVGGYVILTRGGGLTSGTSTIIAGGTGGSGFDFSTGSVVTVVTTGTHDFGIEPWQNRYGTSGSTPAVQGYNGIDNLIKDMGAVELAGVTAAPGTGYSPDAHALVGHVYVIKCRDGNYEDPHHEHNFYRRRLSCNDIFRLGLPTQRVKQLLIINMRTNLGRSAYIPFTTATEITTITITVREPYPSLSILQMNIFLRA